MSVLGAALRTALLGSVARGIARRWWLQAQIGLAAALLIAVCVALALGFGGWALFAALSETRSPAIAAAWVAAMFALLALSVVAIVVLMRRRRRRRAPDLGPGLGQLAALFAGMELPKLGAGTVVAGGLALGLLVGLTVNRPRRR